MTIDEAKRELILLKIKSLIISKRMECETASFELEKYGEWRTNHSAVCDQIDGEIEGLQKSLL